jgi:hypothetical protein
VNEGGREVDEKCCGQRDKGAEETEAGSMVRRKALCIDFRILLLILAHLDGKKNV